MTVNQTNFLEITCAAINNTDIKLEEPVDYDSIIDIAFTHQIASLIFEKLCENKSFIESDTFKKLKPSVILNVLGQASRTEIFLQLYKKFNENNLYPIVLKGIICRQLYGKFSDHRPSSDEDILVKKEDFYNTCDVLLNNGYEPSKDIKSVDLDFLQALSFYNKDKCVHIEVHVNPIGKGNGLQDTMNAFFENVIDDYIEEEVNGVKLRTLNHTNHFLFLVFHAFRHFLGSGFGIRQVIDLLLYEKAYEKYIDWKYIDNAVRTTKSEDFLSDLVYIGNKYLGLELPMHGHICCPDDLLEDLLSNGVFGNDTNAKIMAGTMTFMAVKNNSSENNSNKTLISTIFPNKRYMLRDNPELNDKPWRLPIAWVQRWIRFIKRNKNNGGNLAQESLSIGNRRITLLKKYNIIK